MATETILNNDNYIIDIHAIQAQKISQLEDINNTEVKSYMHAWDYNPAVNDLTYDDGFCYLLLARGGNNYKLEYGTVKDDLGIPVINSNIVNLNQSIECLSYDVDNKINFVNSYHNKLNIIESNNNNDYYIKLSSYSYDWNPRHEKINNNHGLSEIETYKYDITLGLSSDSDNTYDGIYRYDDLNKYVYFNNKNISNNYYNKIYLLNKGLVTDNEFNKLLFNINDFSYYTDINFNDISYYNSALTYVLNDTINNDEYIKLPDATYLKIENIPCVQSYSYHYYTYLGGWAQRIGYIYYNKHTLNAQLSSYNSYIAYYNLGDNKKNTNIGAGLIGHNLFNQLINDINDNSSYFAYVDSYNKSYLISYTTYNINELDIKLSNNITNSYNNLFNEINKVNDDLSYTIQRRLSWCKIDRPKNINPDIPTDPTDTTTILVTTPGPTPSPFINTDVQLKYIFDDSKYQVFTDENYGGIGDIVIKNINYKTDGTENLCTFSITNKESSNTYIHFILDTSNNTWYVKNILQDNVDKTSGANWYKINDNIKGYRTALVKPGETVDIILSDKNEDNPVITEQLPPDYTTTVQPTNTTSSTTTSIDNVTSTTSSK